MAKPRDKDEERAVDIDHLEPELRKTAHDVGFRKRISINKVLRGIDHEKRTRKLSVAFVVVMGIASAASLALIFLLPQERRGQFILIGLFALAWSFFSWLYAKRAAKRLAGLETILGVVKGKLGK